MAPHELHDLGAQIILRPGLDISERAGGFHRFMGWDGPSLTGMRGREKKPLVIDVKKLADG